MYKGEIRDSVINELIEKVTKNNFGKYLKRIKIIKLRGFDNNEINFDFPVTALIGPNGGGKTTILGAAALIHSMIKPRRFFTKSGIYDNSMQDWKVEYDIIDKKESPTTILTKNANYGNYKWSRNSIERAVGLFGISRTVPPSEKIEYSKFASNTFKVDSQRVHKLSKYVADAVTKILGRDVSNYSEIRFDDLGQVTFLTGSTEDGIEYSEFHFGAGESSIIRMITNIEHLEENSLILIEEIENGLHPVATIRMVEYLIDVAERKKIQSIFTTHSNDSLLPLPNCAIWVAFNGKLFQGKLDITSLRAITGKIEAQLAIFVEDIFSKEWIESIMRYNNYDIIESVEVHSLSGDGTAVKFNISHNEDPSIKYKSICFIDGDSKQSESNENKIFRLPGQSPESYIYDKIYDKIDELKGELSVSLHLKYETQELVKKLLKEIRSTNRDEHLLFNQVGKKLGFISENIVRNAFLSMWNKYYETESESIYKIIKDNLQC